MASGAVSKSRTYDMIYTGMFAVLITVCSWISIPMAVPFTLQTFAVFLTVGLLGGRRGTAAIVAYLLLGLAGLPVFAGFTGGPGILFGYTGGYFAGFVFSGLAMWGVEKVLGRKTWALAAGMVLGLTVCYAFGTAWFMAAYGNSMGGAGLGTVLGICVIPFIVPDIIKIVLALALTRRLGGLIDRL